MSELIHLPPDLYARNTVIAFLAGKLCKKQRPGILDVGGFGGRLSEFVGEYSKYVILDKKAHTPEENEQISYMQADAKKIPFSDRNFDVVVASDMMEHVDAADREQVIKELLRVSKNCLIIGAPLKTNITLAAEELIRSQYYANTGVEHPFLLEHEAVGLPGEDEMDRLFNDAGVAFMKIREGNLMNWYMQQLYTGTYSGGMEGFDKYGFYNFYNENIRKLGDLRSPTYRTIYCILKDGQIPSEEIHRELQETYVWDSETFMQLMKIAFDDVRFLINQKNEELVSAEKSMNDLLTRAAGAEGDLEKTLQKARNSTQVYQSAVRELRNYLAEKEQALNYMKAILTEKDARIVTFEQLTHDQEDMIGRLNLELENKEKRLASLITHIHLNERLLQEKKNEIAQKDDELAVIKADLANHRRELQKVINSRAWKAVMIYSQIKKNINKGWQILSRLGPGVFTKRLMRKVMRRKNAPLSEKGYECYIQENKLLPGSVKIIKKQITDFDYMPLISIVMPVYNVAEKWLEKAIESVRGQIYEKWELCICDDASTAPHIETLLKKYAKLDGRIKVYYRQKNGGIVKASNDALKIATGSYVGLLDDDDELEPQALFEIVRELQENRWDMIYTDEDKIGTDGVRTEPFFKPDWSPDLLLSCNYVCHFGVYKRKILNLINGFREGFEGSQDYDLTLRFTEKTGSIKHISQVLYHWRKIAGSAAESVDAKPYAYESAKKALTEALKRRRIEGEVLDGVWHGSYRVKRKIDGRPLVSIIIPFRDHVSVLDKCIKSIESKTKYQNYEIVLVNNKSELFETGEYLERLSGDGKIKVLNFNAPFNYPAINNFAVGHASGDYLILLNNDTEVITPDWIETMLEHAERPEVGAVGVKLFYPDNTIQHAGVLIGLLGLAGHAFCRTSEESNIYFGMANVIRNSSAVTAACMMVKKDVYLKVGGLNEKDLSVGYNDVDFCLRLREQGYLILYTPFAELYHHESYTRGYDINIKEVEWAQRRHAKILKKGDPYYNKNLTLERGDFSLRCMDKVKER
jgi:O-antigen biosynthesis protein